MGQQTSWNLILRCNKLEETVLDPRCKDTDLLPDYIRSSKIPKPMYRRKMLLLSPYILAFIYMLAHIKSDTKSITGKPLHQHR